ncbi:thiamine phosphate synthase [Senegalia massiliensis]|uniref:Thiamine-phosphate synthase n=1 Tax=Senegalia massiliensis TaxID=1720316 RepID=A0A845R0X8_9CLOT|nr:thiamine phosphate synthase [Senegalia massiliensis]NBI07148.1 thiamine phosphate synthase [Senegalia massiliensis]
MKIDKKSMLLYVVTDRTWLGENSLIEQVEDTLKAGATFIQLREKDFPFEDFLKEAKEIKNITDRYKVPFVINDNVDIAMKCGADGVHVGQGDMNAKNARNIIGEDKILGVSASTVEQAKIAEENGADYIGVGSAFKTNTKSDVNVISMDTLKDICNSVSIPVVAIGGINEENIFNLKNTDIDGICVISAIFSKENIYDATKKLYDLASKMVNYEV